MADSDYDVLDYSPLYKKFEHNKFRNDNELSFQHPCSALITAGSGQGKGNLLLNLLTHEKLRMTYDEVYLCVPSLDEPCYQFLQSYYEKKRKQVLKQVNKDLPANKKLKIDDIPQIFYHISNPNDIPLPETSTDEPVRQKKPKATAKSKQQSSLGGPKDHLMTQLPPAVQLPNDEPEKPKYILKNDDVQKIVIIDDFTGNPIANDKIVRLCQKNRKVNTSLIVLNHDLFKLEPTFKRNLSNGYICLFKASTKRMISQFAQDFALGMNKDQFYKIFNYATKEPYSFLLVDLKTKDEALRFRKKLHETNLIKMVEDAPSSKSENEQLIELLKKLKVNSLEDSES